MLSLDMKRFLILTFVLLSLCSHIAHAQDNTNPSNDPAASSTTEETQEPAVATNGQPNQEKEEENQPPMPESLTIEDRMAELSDEANDYALAQTIIGGIGLLLVALATWFAWGAWQAGKLAVEVTREMGIAQARSYVDILDVHCVGKPRTNLDEKVASRSKAAAHSGESSLIFEFSVRNSGSTPAENVVISYTCKAHFSGKRPIVPKPNHVKFGYIGPRSESYKLSVQNCEILEKEKESDELIIELTIVTHSTDRLSMSAPAPEPTILTQRFFGIYRTHRPLTASDGSYVTAESLEKQRGG